jgi:hypothetical protein
MRRLGPGGVHVGPLNAGGDFDIGRGGGTLE